MESEVTAAMAGPELGRISVDADGRLPAKVEYAHA